AHAEVASGECDKGFAGDRLHGQGSGEVVSVEAEASAGVEFSKRAAGIHAKVGASANLVKGTLGGDIRIPLPFGHTLSLGGEAEGMIGAAAEASGGAGWSQSKGGFAHAKVKLGFGPGLGFGFKIGFK
ncbi:MAG: hypothetical protein NTY38_06910, partial [Acidobacteria bacterium]|nr:hypothetical protein [Acidobacteriota bacterium]